MDTKEVLTVVGWVVSCLLSVIAGGVIIPRLTRKKKILAWALVTESELIARNLQKSLSLPLVVQVGGTTPKSLSLITLRIGNDGNEVIEGITVAIALNPGATALYIKPAEDLGEFQRHVLGKIEPGNTTLSFGHLNPRKDYQFQLLIADYDAGSVSLDAAAAGVDVVRKDAARWRAPISILTGFSLNLAGVRYDPQVTVLASIATELKAIRSSLQLRERGRG